MSGNPLRTLGFEPKIPCQPMLNAVCSPITLLNIGVAVGAVVAQFPLVAAKVFLVCINLPLLGLPLLIPLSGSFCITALDGAVFFHLIVIPLEAVVSELLLVLPGNPPVGANVPVIAADIAVFLVNFIHLLLLCFGERFACQPRAQGESGRNPDRQN